MRRTTLSASLVSLCALAACGDDATTASDATIRVELASTTPGVQALCFSAEARDGRGDEVLASQDACTTEENPAGIEFACDPSPETAAHTVTVHVTGIFLEGGADFDPADPGAGDLETVSDPCPDGCTTTVTCTAGASTPAIFNLTIMRRAEQGFFGVAVNAQDFSELGLGSACYDLRVENGEGDLVFEPRELCSDLWGDGTKGSVSYVAPCDASDEGAVHTVSIEVTGLYAETTSDPAGGPGLLGDYSYTCDGGCTRSVTCVKNADVLIDFDLTISRVYAAGTVVVDVPATVDGEGSEDVGGACYTLAIANALEQELVNRDALCSAFHPHAGSETAGITFTAPCDGTPYGEDGTTHVATLTLDAVYAAEDAPAQSGLPPAQTLEGYTNPCPEEAPCTATFTCLEGDSAEVTFEIGITFPEPADD